MNPPEVAPARSRRSFVGLMAGAAALAACSDRRNRPSDSADDSPVLDRSGATPGPGDHYLALDHDGRERTYLLHVPPSAGERRRMPLLFGLHGGGGTGDGFQRSTLGGFDRLADKHGWLVAYPDAVERLWNDGRKVTAYRSQRDGIDDVGFIAALVDQLASKFDVNQSRVYATGISNGAILCHLLACRLADRVASIAPVAGSIAENVAAECKPGAPVSVITINGTSDPLIRWEGGEVMPGPLQPGSQGKLGTILPVESAVHLWVERNGCSETPTTSLLTSKHPRDGMPVRQSLWSGGRSGSEVALVTVEGGGHGWPGGTQYAPKATIGTVKRDFDGCQLIWDFFN